MSDEVPGHYVGPGETKGDGFVLLVATNPNVPGEEPDCIDDTPVRYIATGSHETD